MPRSVSVPVGSLQGDLARVQAHEASDEWPTMLEITAYWSKDGSRKGRRRSIEISADQFFGRGGYGAPMQAETLFAMIERLRRQGPKP
jgi:hypothetical protein